MAQRKKPAPPPPPKKLDEPPVEEGLPIWMATFADMVTLLLCFFVLLLSFANQDITQFQTLMGSIRDAFGVQMKRPDANFAALSPSKYERDEVSMDQEQKALLGVVSKLTELIEEDEKLKKSVEIKNEDQGVVMRVPSELLFEPGDATLKPQADQVLDDVIKVLKEHNFDLVVRGHTADTYTTSATFPSNWELTAQRAATTLRRILEKSDIPSSRLKAIGYADSNPMVPNTTEANRNLNRRMEFFFHRPESNSW